MFVLTVHAHIKKLFELTLNQMDLTSIYKMCFSVKEGFFFQSSANHLPLACSCVRGQPCGESHFSWKAHGVDTLLPGTSVIDFSLQSDVKAHVIPSVDTKQ